MRASEASVDSPAGIEDRMPVPSVRDSVINDKLDEDIISGLAAVTDVLPVRK